MTARPLSAEHAAHYRDMAARLRSIRLAMGYPSVVKFAAMLGVPASTVRLIEAGGRTNTTTVLVVGMPLAERGVTLDWLICGISRRRVPRDVRPRLRLIDGGAS